MVRIERSTGTTWRALRVGMDGRNVADGEYNGRNCVAQWCSSHPNKLLSLFVSADRMKWAMQIVGIYNENPCKYMSKNITSVCYNLIIVSTFGN